MKALHIIQRYPPSIGGSEVWCQNVCQYLAEEGHDVKVLTLDVYKEDEFWRDPPLEDCLLRFGRLEYDGKVKVIRCKRTKINPLIFCIIKLLDGLFKVYLYGPHSVEIYIRMITEIKECDIVHLHTLPFPHNLAGLFIAKLFAKKAVITPHFHIGHHYYERKINFWLMKKCDAVFTDTQREREYLISKGLKGKKVVAAYGAIDAEEYRPLDLDNFKQEIFRKHGIEKNAKIIIFIGRKIEYKGIDTLIEAVKVLRKKIPVKLFLAGPDFPWFREYYASLSDDEKKDIIDFGTIPHQKKVNLLHLSSLLVLPSKFEAFGIVLLEGWICGLPVIGSDSGILAGVIDKCGLVFRHGDIHDLSEKIAVLLKNPNLSEEMARCGRERVINDYSRSRLGQEVSNAYFLLSKNNQKFQCSGA